MDYSRETTPRHRLPLIGTVVVLLLGIRFTASATLAATNLPQETLATIGRVLEMYEVALPFILVLAFLLIAASVTEGRLERVAFALVGFQLVVLLLWLYDLGTASHGALEEVYVAMAAGAVVLGAVFAQEVSRSHRPARRSWGGWAYLALLVVVPFAFLLRAAAGFGLGMSAGTSGALQGSWLVVNVPTLLLELLAMAVWANLVLDAGPSRLRMRWYAFLPLAAVPVLLAGFFLAPLSGYILSALITWGSNLALFAPAPLSLVLAAGAIACYLSSFILLKKEGEGGGWKLLLLGTATIGLAGFYPSMASVEGLAVGLLLAAVAFSNSTEQAAGKTHRAASAEAPTP